MGTYTQELEALIQHELLPVYFRYYRLLNTPTPLTEAQLSLIKDLDNKPKLCKLVQPSNQTN